MDITRHTASRDERASAVRAWQAVPHRRRTEVVRAAERGERHSDTAALAAGQRACRALLADRGPAWHQRTHPRATAAVCLVVGAVVLVASVAVLWLSGGRDVGSWVFAAAGALVGVYGAHVLSFQRDAARLLALGDAETSERPGS